MNDIASVMGGAFRPDSVDGAADGFEPLPAGWYPVDIDSAEMTETNAKDGYYIKVQTTVLGDKFAGRKLFGNINIVNPNPTTVGIGKRELAQLGFALGLEEIGSCAPITGQLEVKIKVTAAGTSKKTGKSFEVGNEITAYRPLGGGKATPAPTAQGTAATPPPIPETTAAPVAAPTTTAAPAAAGKMPWQK